MKLQPLASCILIYLDGDDLRFAEDIMDDIARHTTIDFSHTTFYQQIEELMNDGLIEAPIGDLYYQLTPLGKKTHLANTKHILACAAEMSSTFLDKENHAC